jgi:hypothetical protein
VESGERDSGLHGVGFHGMWTRDPQVPARSARDSHAVMLRDRAVARADCEVLLQKYLQVHSTEGVLKGAACRESRPVPKSSSTCVGDDRL